MRVPSRTLVSCATIALTFAALALADEPAKKSDGKSDGKSEQTSEEKSENKGGQPVDAERKPDARKAQEKVEKAKKGDDEPIVFTNGDLEALFGKAEPEPAPEPLVTDVAVRPGGRTAESGQPDKTKARIEAIQAEIKRLNEMNRSLRNPYLRRVETTDEEKKAYANKGADERIRINNERIAALRDELAKLQSARSAPQSPSRR